LGKDEEWNDIFGHLEYSLGKHISDKIEKKSGNGRAFRKWKVEKERPKRKFLSEAELKELEK
jgi:hypothetical protein